MKKAKLNSAVINAVELSTNQKDSIHNAVGYQLEVIEMDNLYNKDRASLKKLLHENIALAMGDEPSYTSNGIISMMFLGVKYAKQRAWNLKVLIKTYGLILLRIWNWNLN
jgi:hypothetical protein